MRLSQFIILAALPLTATATSFNEVVDSICAHNLEIKAIEQRLEGDAASIRSTNNLEATSVDFEYLVGRKAIGDKYAIGISQGFDWPGVYATRGKANKLSISALSYSAISQTLDIRLEIKQMCIDMVYVNKQIALRQQLLNNMNLLLEGYKKALENGETTIIEINKLRITVLDIERELKNFNIQREALVASITAANSGIAIDTSLINSLLEYPNGELHSLTHYQDIVNSVDPDLDAFQAQAEASQLNVKTAKMGYIPSLRIGYKYVNELGEKFHGVTAGIAIPLFSNRHKTRASRAYSIASQLGASQLEVSKKTQVASQHSALTTLKEQLETYEKALDPQNIEVLNRALSASHISLLNYLLEVKFFIEAQCNYLAMEHEYHTLKSKLDRYDSLLQ